MLIVKDLVRAHYVELTRKSGYFYNTQHFKMISVIMITLYQDISQFSNFIQFLEHLYTYTNTTKRKLSIDNDAHAI